ncbi:MAG: hypothetical protein IPK31_14620 [Chitinophagaceae bacterium]|nr:hypothetical protein [Chitinophagaceae bacterium]
MKTAIIFLSSGILFLLLLSLLLKISFTTSSVDLHISDTYYIISKKTAALSVLLFLVILFLIGRATGSKRIQK